MPRTMYDSTNPFDIPQGVDLAGGYVDGAYAWSAAGWTRHSGSKVVKIACFASTNDGMVLDIESGCSSAEEASGWARLAHARGQFPTLYFSLSLFGRVSAAMSAAGFSPSDWAVWAADWTGQPHILPGTYATQYASPSLGSPGHYDLSLVADYWPGIDQGPPAGPGPSAPAQVQIGTGGAGKVYIAGYPAPQIWNGNVGEVVTFLAVPDAGWHFYQWVGTGGSATQNPLVVTLSAMAGYLTALFNLDTAPGPGGGGTPPPGGGGSGGTSGPGLNGLAASWAQVQHLVDGALPDATARSRAVQTTIDQIG